MKGQKLLVSLAVLQLCLTMSGIAVAQPKDLALGFGNCSPAVFLKLQPSMAVKIYEIDYASSGALDSYKKEEFRYGNAEPVSVKVTVNHQKWTGLCDSLGYEVDIDGKRLMSPTVETFSKAQTKGAIGFTATESAGAILNDPILEANLETEIGYDEKNRKQIRRQTVTQTGRKYKLTYSDYSYDKLGRLLSYSVQIDQAAK